jgi:hypothetical protein
MFRSLVGRINLYACLVNFIAFGLFSLLSHVLTKKKKKKLLCCIDDDYFVHVYSRSYLEKQNDLAIYRVN